MGALSVDAAHERQVEREAFQLVDETDGVVGPPIGLGLSLIHI